ncbi:glutathione synthase/RimK-type ligase-like ATP-grasp enzyme [Nitrosospira multiformis]|uniref:Glutathione synthase/RimK-type ligase-like ATP-grasp enzyme n=1 Tax=Nitrosospira multiformis TaxID=1231 RepID=A0A2T5I610_9PROT|nr:glutathione synthase/RimK-type ligase-like ATP-grasp enzyme [Nitrosospira multiformis]
MTPEARPSKNPTATIRPKRFPVSILIIVDKPEDWPLQIPGVTVIGSQAYLTDPFFATQAESNRGMSAAGQSVKVFNLCKSYRYQGSGYYVSLLAEARGHKPVPKVGAIEDLHSRNLVRHLTEDLEDLVQSVLAPLPGDDFQLAFYFGRNPLTGYDSLGHQFFSLLQVPLLVVRFERHRNQWSLHSARPLGASEIPVEHQAFAILAATTYFNGRMQQSRKPPPRHDLAILCNPDESEPPSNAEALQKFRQAAEKLDMHVDFITRADIGRLAHFDALFIRETTFVNHYTYRFSRLAFAERLALVDDPDSILKCNNKVYLAELLALHKVPIPKTLLIHRDNIDQVIPELGLPCVLKQPDSSFSRGVVKVEAESELLPKVTELLAKSVLVIAQQWLPTEFDWRIGILDRKVLFVAKYFFPAGHWQIIERDEQRHKLREGATLAVPLDEAPQDVVSIALKSANLIGDGFYGVDIKQTNAGCYVMEVNDNPNVDAGNEDAVLGEALYEEIMRVFLRRIEAARRSSR